MSTRATRGCRELLSSTVSWTLGPQVRQSFGWTAASPAVLTRSEGRPGRNCCWYETWRGNRDLLQFQTCSQVSRATSPQLRQEVPSGLRRARGHSHVRSLHLTFVYICAEGDNFRAQLVDRTVEIHRVYGKNRLVSCFFTVSGLLGSLKSCWLFWCSHPGSSNGFREL